MSWAFSDFHSEGNRLNSLKGAVPVSRGTGIRNTSLRGKITPGAESYNFIINETGGDNAADCRGVPPPVLHDEEAEQ